LQARNDVTIFIRVLELVSKCIISVIVIVKIQIASIVDIEYVFF
jgi:hypothetical protein